MSTNRNKRGQSVGTSKKENRCDKEIRFFYNEDYDSWNLHINSNFEHSFHIKESEESQTLNKSDLNKAQLTTLNGVAPSVIAKAMTDAVKLSTGKDGEFLSSKVQNIGNQERAAINKLHGINPDWSIAQKVIAELDK